MANRSDKIQPPAAKACANACYWLIGLSSVFTVLVFLHLHGHLPAEVQGVSVQLALQWMLGAVYSLGAVVAVLSFRQHLYLRRLQQASNSGKKAKVRVEDGYEEDADIV